MANDIDIKIGVSGGDDILKVAKLTQKLDRDVATLAKTFNKGKITNQAYFKGLNQQVSALTKQGIAYKRAQTYVFAQAKAVRDLDAKTDILTGSINQNTGAVLNNAKALGNTKNKMNGNNMALQQLGYQFGDFAVQVQGGTSAFVAFSQQGAQLAGILPMIAGPLGLTMGAAVGLSAALGVIIPIGSAVGRMLFEMGGKAKQASVDFKTALSDFESISEETAEHLELALAGPFLAAKTELQSLLLEYKKVRAEIAKDALATEVMPIVGAVAGRMDELSEKKKATQAFQDISGQDKTAEINAIAMAQLEGTGLLNAINKALQGPTDKLVDNMMAVGTAFEKSDFATKSMKDSMLELLGQSGVLASASQKQTILEEERTKKAKERAAIIKAVNENETKLFLQDAADRLAAEEAIKKAEQDAMKTRAGFMALGLSNSLAQEIANKKEEAAVKKITDAVDKNTKSSQRKIILNRAELDVLDNVAGAEERLAVLKAEHAREDHIAKLVAEKILGKNLDAAMEHYDYLVYQQTALDDLNEKEKARLDLIQLQVDLETKRGQALDKLTGGNKEFFDPRNESGVSGVIFRDRGKPSDKSDTGTSTGKSQAETDAETIASFQKRLDLETELLGKTEARQEVLQALGVDLAARAPKDAARMEAQIAETNELIAVEQRRQALVDSINGSIEDGFMAMSDGTKSVSDAFRTMAAEIVRELYKVYVMQVAIKALKLAMGIPFADGGVISGGSEVKAYANGGVVGGPTTFPMAGGKTGLMGEAGPEAIMPLKRGANGKLGVQMEGGGGDTINVVQNFSFAANGDDSVKRIIAQAAPQIAQMTKNSMLNDRRRGGTTKAVFG